MSDRHEKWVKVEPGTVIPAGQPYRVERKPVELTWNMDQEVTPDRCKDSDWFVDSSWKPPLVLPTEPTWGIAVSTAGYSVVGQWSFDRGHREFYSQHFYRWRLERVADFIPLTPEQVARIEAAR